MRGLKSFLLGIGFATSASAATDVEIFGGPGPLHGALRDVVHKRRRRPEINADSITALVGEGILAASKEDSYRAMAAFRNRPVHLYWGVSDERVYDYLRDSIGDLESFAQAVARLK